jgi:hypothetical protein
MVKNDKYKHFVLEQKLQAYRKYVMGYQFKCITVRTVVKHTEGSFYYEGDVHYQKKTNVKWAQLDKEIKFLFMIGKDYFSLRMRRLEISMELETENVRTILK